jgi:IMP and pyridine-specific 5'-nucleotidase
MGPLFTPLPLARAYDIYDRKYAISSRRFVSPSFNEIRHMLNLAQVMAIGTNLKLMTFDGDQTLYSDGGNFENNRELAGAIIDLLAAGVAVAVVTAAGYGLDGPKYEVRLEGLLRAMENAKTLDSDSAGRLFVLGGECNYLLRCELSTDQEPHSTRAGLRLKRTARLVGVPTEEWQAHSIKGPKPALWDELEVKNLLDLSYDSVCSSIQELRLRAKILRKPRSIGVIPGGDSMVGAVPEGHGSKKLKREALDEIVLRVIDTLKRACDKVKLPFCAFNGGRDAWVDVGDKSVGVAALQAWLGVDNAGCMHVGDQFLNTGNDIKARETCPCLWITSPAETAKMLLHVIAYCKIEGVHRFAGPSNEAILGSPRGASMSALAANLSTSPTTQFVFDFEDSGPKPKMNVFTGEFQN